MERLKQLRFSASVLLRTASILLVVTITGYLLVLCSPNDPVESYMAKGATAEQRAVIEKNWGLDKPFPVRYGIWLGNVLHGNFGQSIVYAQPVGQILKKRAGATLLLLVLAWILSGVFGFAAGLTAGVYRGRLPDRIIKGICFFFASLPPFWLGLLAVMLFAVKLKIFPLGFSSSAGAAGTAVSVGDRLYHAVLPSLTLGLVGIPKIAMHTREKISGVMHSEYMLFAYTRGESRWTAVRRHGIRNCILPALTLQFNSINELFSGSVLAEQVFSYPGLGNAATMAGLNGDANLLLGVTVVSALIVIAGNAAANLLYGLLDPLVREAYKKNV
jgi:peptide/nickel transport system permease protein